MLALLLTGEAAPQEAANAHTLAAAERHPRSVSLGEIADQWLASTKKGAMKDIASRIFQDGLAEERAAHESRQRLLVRRQGADPRSPPPGSNVTVSFPRHPGGEDPHFRNIKGWHGPETVMPDKGTFPKAMIAGQGKCGTNALAEALYRLNYNYPLTEYSITVEEARQGWAGEVNWPQIDGCETFLDKKSLADYRQLFTPVDGFGYNWLDKSTSNVGCAKEIAQVFPKDTKFFNIMCDPVMALWSRMNQVRQVYGTSNPLELEYVLEKRLYSGEKDCSQLVVGDKRLEAQLELCYQLQDGMNMLEMIRKWKNNLGNRSKFLIAEQSKKDRSYLIREAARHLNVPEAKDIYVGDVHTYVDKASYLEPEGPVWDAFVKKMRPVFQPLIKSIAHEFPVDFPWVIGQWSSVF